MSHSIARLRRLLSEAVPTQSKDPPIVVILDASPRARCEREILRLADNYGWKSEIIRFLDQECVLSLASLELPALERLRDRMRKLEDCLKEGLDHPDCASAR